VSTGELGSGGPSNPCRQGKIDVKTMMMMDDDDDDVV